MKFPILFGSEEGSIKIQTFDFNAGGDLVIGGRNSGTYPSTELRIHCVEADSAFVNFYDNAFEIKWGRFLSGSFGLNIQAIKFWNSYSSPNQIVIASPT